MSECSTQRNIPSSSRDRDKRASSTLCTPHILLLFPITDKPSNFSLTRVIIRQVLADSLAYTAHFTDPLGVSRDDPVRHSGSLLKICFPSSSVLSSSPTANFPCLFLTALLQVEGYKNITSDCNLPQSWP